MPAPGRFFEVIRPGDRVCSRATNTTARRRPNRRTVHMAINEGDEDHDVLRWLKPVTDEEYAAAPAGS